LDSVDCGVWPAVFTDIYGWQTGQIYMVQFYADLDDPFNMLVHYPFYFNEQCVTVDSVAPFSGDPVAVWGDSPDNVFVAAQEGHVYQFDGSNWDSTDMGFDEALLGIWGLGPSEVYAVGANGRAVKYNGTAWSQMETGATGNFNAVWGIEEAIYAVGDDDATLPVEDRSPAIYRFDGTGWMRVY
jgi:hypothetical protein